MTALLMVAFRFRPRDNEGVEQIRTATSWTENRVTIDKG